MQASLTWVDYDQEAYRQSQRLLALFNERNTRDELGLGSIRDSFADRLFPGTSTIQTRLGYMLIIPWMYQELEDRQTPSSAIADRAERYEKNLIGPLRDTQDDRGGVVGVEAGKGLRTLPSQIYWSGLGTWGIRLFRGTRGQYHNALDDIYRRRDRLGDQRRWSGESQDDSDAISRRVRTWHPNIPDPPPDFPEQLDLKLTREEAHFLQDRVQNRCGDAFLSHLFLHPTDVDVRYAWELPDVDAFKPSHRRTLGHARVFSLVMNGASLLYNLMLAEIIEREELADEHRENLQDWAEEVLISFAEVRDWAARLDQLWDRVEGYGHRIGPLTRTFVERWVEVVVEHRADITEATDARQLVRHREMQKKGRNSRFTNRRTLEQWSGHSGTGRLDYRWPTVRTLLADLYEGLETDA